VEHVVLVYAHNVNLLGESRSTIRTRSICREH